MPHNNQDAHNQGESKCSYILVGTLPFIGFFLGWIVGSFIPNESPEAGQAGGPMSNQEKGLLFGSITGLCLAFICCCCCCARANAEVQSDVNRVAESPADSQVAITVAL